MLGLGGLGGYLPGQVPGGAANFSNAARSAAGGGGMEPVTAALLSTGISAGLPYVMDFGSYLYDLARGEPEVDLTLQQKEFADLNEELAGVNQEAIRRARATAGQALGANMAMSGAAGLSSFNPVLAAMARQGELQAGRTISGMERQGVQDRADFAASRAEAINRQLANLKGSSARRANIARAYAEGSMDNSVEAERYRAAAASMG